MFRAEEAFSEKTMTAFTQTLYKGWLTRQYFSRGKHDLVLPQWILGQLGPAGEGNHGIAGALDLKNTDLRDYYALGSPRSEEEPVVDHRGGIIPSPESYTIIFGTVIDGRPFYSSEVGEVTVEYGDDGNPVPVVSVFWKVDNDTMVFDAFADRDDDGNEVLGIDVVRGFANHPLLVTVCPLDQDSVTFLPRIEYDSKDQTVTIEGQPSIKINEEPIRVTAVPIAQGHAGRLVTEATLDSEEVDCPAGLASWAAQFPVRATPLFSITLAGEPGEYQMDYYDVLYDWEDLMEESIPEIDTSDENANYFFRASATVLRLLSDIGQKEVTVGPSVQEKMWLPAMVFQCRALDRLGFEDVVKVILDHVHSKVDANGLVVNDQQWDAQGAVILAMVNHFYKTGDLSWIGDKYSAIKRVGEWVSRQRKKSEESNLPPEIDGLVSPGNASWFNPLYWKLDYYYSHNFWSMSVFDNIVQLSTTLGRHADSEKYEPELEKFKQAIDDSITKVTEGLNYLPAGPYQRDNAAMVFNLSAFYPLKLYLPAFQALQNTVNWIWENYTHEGGVLIDQPFNAYGTYHSILLAQAFRYIGQSDPVIEIIEFMLNNTTNKSGWAEGISTLTRKGAVGDSPNGYAAAEYVNLILDLFAEDNKTGSPVLLKGMPIQWLENGISAKNLKLFHNATLDISAKIDDGVLVVEWDYQNSQNDILPILWLPKPAKTLPPDVEQLSTRELKLTKPSGYIEIKLA